MTLMNVLALVALLPGIFLFIVALCKKAEETRQLNRLEARRIERNEADNHAAWLRNKQMWMK